MKNILDFCHSFDAALEIHCKQEFSIQFELRCSSSVLDHGRFIFEEYSTTDINIIADLKEV